MEFPLYRNPVAGAVKALLLQCRLPIEDLTPAHLQNFLGYGGKSSPVAVVGVEIYGTIGLLRSLAVAEEARGSGVGTRLVNAIECFAKYRGVVDLYLLTSTAKRFFESLGYSEIARVDAPAAIAATKEFSSICPGTATFMVKPLNGAGDAGSRICTVAPEDP